MRSKYRTAIGSWLSSSSKSRVILFVTREEFDKAGKLPNEIDQIYGRDRVYYAGNLRTDLLKIPYLDDWFRKGIRLSQSKYVCFINTDILISKGWLNRHRQVFQALPDKKVFIIGQRIDFDADTRFFNSIHFGSENLLEEIESAVMSSKHEEHSEFGMDTFTFRADEPPFDPEKFPPFLIGRFNWDNWFVGWMNTIADTVSVQLDPPVYHMNHVRHDFNINNSKVAVNHYLKIVNENYFGLNTDTKWYVSDQKLISRYGNQVIPLK